jgi:AmmeMemoRadiSam system protein A
VISAQEQQQLLGLARRALEARVKGAQPPAVDEHGDIPAGAFVSIHRRNGDLRGCLGRIEGDWPLPRLVAHLASIVADSDPRFEAVRPEELDDIEIEISILTPEQPVTRLEEIEVGRHGLIVDDGRRRGLLLPQVASEHAWDAPTFVQHTCRKAGLPLDAWPNRARLFAFEAQVFSEPPAPHG